MAHFRGRIQGRRGEASRLGDKRDGLWTNAASWQGAVDVQLEARDDGVDWALVRLTRHCHHGTDRVLYHGPIGQYKPNGRSPYPPRKPRPKKVRAPAMAKRPTRQLQL